MYYLIIGKSKVYHEQVYELACVAIMLKSDDEMSFHSERKLSESDLSHVRASINSVKASAERAHSKWNMPDARFLRRVAASLEAFIQADKDETDVSLKKKISIEVNAWEVNRRDPDGLFAFVYDCADEQGIDMSLLH